MPYAAKPWLIRARIYYYDLLPDIIYGTV
jgi:hypothetical protein